MAQHNDEPCLVDRLNRRRLVEQVGAAVASCAPPQVFGVHGDWGLGKTSFLHQLHYHLTGECPQQTEKETEAATGADGPEPGKFKEIARVVWFEAWRYQTEQAPVVALLHEMRSQLEWHLKFAARVGKIAEVAVRGALLSLEDLTKLIGFQASKIEKAGEQWEREHLAARLPSHTMREQLTRAINGLLSEGLGISDARRRVVMIIDDLDRCDPEAAYRLLEGLKIYLTLPNCVFVIGMNQRIVEDAIGKHVPIGEKQEHLRLERASAYLEKLCQNVWRLPAIANPKAFLVSLLPDDVRRQWIDRAIGTPDCLPPNPRRLKGFANLLQRFSDRHLPGHGAGDDPKLVEQARLVVIVAYVYQFHHDLYRHWETNPSLFEHLRAWVQSVDPAAGGPVADLFGRLRRAVLIQSDPTTTTPTWTVGSAFPDPYDSNVFWIQRLIHELGPEISSDTFLPYLRA